MNSLKKIKGIIYFLLLACISCKASEESPLIFKSFTIESNEVRVAGIGGDGGLTDLRVRAFGRDFKFNGKDMEKLSGIKINGVQIYSDGGYSGAGGERVVVLLSTGYTTGIVDKKYLTIMESGDFEITDSIE